MRLIVVQTGGLRDEAVVAARDEYLKRFRRFGSLTVTAKEPKGDAPLWPSSSRWRVALDERGDGWSSAAFAKKLGDWTMRHGEVAFLIGGAYGHHQPSLALADARWSLGALTLPHAIAHLVVVEQLYRAATIRAGLPYHH